jgi:integration host factor subunit beta
MIKSEFIHALSIKQPHLTLSDVDAAVHCIIEKMITELASGGRVEIRGFGSFSLKHRRAKIGRNPKTGVAVSVPQKHTVYFKPGADLKKRVDDSSTTFKIIH